MESRHMTIVKAAGFMLVWTVILFTLAAAVYGIAGDGDLLAREMFRHAPRRCRAMCIPRCSTQA